MSSVSKAAADILLGLKRYRVWHVIGMEDLRLRYRRTAFGVLWLTATFSLFILAKSFVFSGLMPVPFKEYTLYMSVAFLVWGFISSIFIDGCMIWVNSEAWLRGVNVPKSIFVYQVVWRNLVTASYSGLAVIAIFVILKAQLTWYGLIALPGLLLLIVNAIWISFFLSIIATRFRDVFHLTKTFIGLMFFVTPILWIPNTMGPRFELFALWNPFAHMIAVIRDPLVYGTSDPISWIVCGSFAVIGSVVGFLTFAHLRNRIIFWF